MRQTEESTSLPDRIIELILTEAIS